MDALRSQALPALVKELLVFAIVYGWVRQVIAESGQCQGVPRSGYGSSVRWVGCGVPRLGTNGRGCGSNRGYGNVGRSNTISCGNRAASYGEPLE
jgi:hypothetical protein